MTSGLAPSAASSPGAGDGTIYRLSAADGYPEAIQTATQKGINIPLKKSL